MGSLSSSTPSATSASMVFVVDDDQALSGAVASLLESVGYSVKEFSNPTEVLEDPLVAMAGCLIVDVRLKGYSGFELQQRILESGSRLPIIFITGYGDIPMSVRAMKAGAANFLTKPFRSQDLIDAVTEALAGYYEYIEKQKALDSLRERFDFLTPRERQVMRGVVIGLLNKQIANDLDVSEMTVKLHRANMMRKMHINTIADVVRAGHKLGIL